jgi:LuxR family transcriptional regulator, quorum-sensing system regulator BjaR1
LRYAIAQNQIKVKVIFDMTDAFAPQTLHFLDKNVPGVSGGYRSGMFETFLEGSLKANSEAELTNLLRTALARLGYDRMIFSVFSDPDLPAERIRHGLINHYPDDFQTFYAEKRLEVIDPVIRCACVVPWAFRWSDIEKAVKLSQTQSRLFRAAEDFGMHNGIGVPIPGPGGRLSGFGLASSVADGGDRSAFGLDLVNALCQQFFGAFKRLNLRETPPYEGVARDFRVSLTPKQREILTWVAGGKTDEDIASILNISRNTVDTHMRQIFNRLSVNSRVSAVVKAINLGLIRP